MLAAAAAAVFVVFIIPDLFAYAQGNQTKYHGGDDDGGQVLGKKGQHRATSLLVLAGIGVCRRALGH
jgi:hypothetical protein